MFINTGIIILFHALIFEKRNTETMIKNSVHTRIRHIRESAGLSQAAMAEELGIGRTTYINFETGKTKLFSSVFSSFIKYCFIIHNEILKK